MDPDEPFALLSRISCPADVRRLAPGELAQLANELRQFLIHTVSQMGGHFAAGLGTVELTVALHYVFDTPDDRLVWRTRCSPGDVIDCARSSSATALRHSRAGPKAPSTPSVSVIRAPRSALRSAWRSLRPAPGVNGESWR
jgi:1-deoxy-D-xylulose-5-phosphate synthase